MGWSLCHKLFIHLACVLAFWEQRVDKPCNIVPPHWFGPFTELLAAGGYFTGNPDLMCRVPVRP